MILYYLLVWFSAVPNQPWFGAQFGGQGFTVFKYVGFAAFIYAIAYVGIKGKFPVLLETWQARFFVALTVLAFFSYLALGNKTDIAMSPIMSYLSFLFMFFVTMALIDSIPRLRYVVLSIIGALAIASLYLLREWQKAGFREGYRAGWVTGDANYFGVNAILALMLAYYLLRTKLPFWQKAFCLGCAGLTALALAASESRGAFIGICVCAVFLFFRTKRKLPFVVAALILGVLFVVLPNSPLKRIIHPQAGAINSTRAHEMLFYAGIKVFAEHPLVGVGLGNFKHTMDLMGINAARGGYIAHDVYIEYAAEMGILAVLLFLGLLVSTYRSLGKVRKEARRRKDAFFFAVTSGMQTGLIGFCVASLFLSAEYQKTFWIVIFLSACMPNLFRLRVREGLRQSQTPSSESALALSSKEEQEPDFFPATSGRN